MQLHVQHVIYVRSFVNADEVCTLVPLSMSLVPRFRRVQAAERDKAWKRGYLSI